MNPMFLRRRAEHLDANPGHYLRRDGTCHCELEPVPLEAPLRTVRTAPHRRLYHYWSTVQGKALCRRNMRLRVLSDYAEGQPICADCVRVKEQRWSTQEGRILSYVFGTMSTPVPVLPPHMRSQNAQPIRSRYRSRKVRL